MTLDDFAAVNSAAILSIESLLNSWFPNGVREGIEFCIGSSSGEAGKSMRIRLEGDKAGVWADFSDDGVAGADLISLYAHIHGVKQGKACADLAAQLGITLTPSDFSSPGATRLIVSAKPKNTPSRAPAQADKGVQAVSEAKTKTPWEPILPVPDDAGPYPKAHVVRGKPDVSWEYRDQGGQLLGVIYRFTTSDGGKEVLPCVFAQHPVTNRREWRWMSFPVPRPLYLRGPLRADLPVLVLEGEKCTDRAHDMLVAELDAVSWVGGGKAVDKSDWTPLAGRTVILWADADAKRYKEKHKRAGELMPEMEQPGMAAMIKIAGILRGLGCSVFFVDVPAPGEVADGWDVADLIDGGAGVDEVMSWVAKLRAEDVEPQPVAGPVSAPAKVGDDVPDWVDEQMDSLAVDGSTPLPAGAGMSPKQLRSQLIQTANGGVKGCRENVYTVMEGDPRLIGLVGLDLFSGLQIKRRAPPWRSEPGEWTEGDDFHLGVYLSQNHSLLLAAIGDIERGVAQAAREHAFNPVTDYMDRCSAMWDGKPRVAGAFARYWGCADNTEYLELVSTMFFVGIVVRAYRPGAKHDYAPVFEGGQGEGKSTALKVLGGDWFADTPFRMGEKDGYLSIQGVLLYEVAELEQFNRSEVTAIKAFMSSTVDRFREPYGRRMKNMPRRCAFAATTNEGEYFKDSTGNRRFWPVATGRIDLDALIEDRDQLFGEAVAMMNAGVLTYPTREQQTRLVSPEQETREIPDPWHGHIYRYLEGIDADGMPKITGPINRVTVLDLLTRGLHFEVSKLGPAKLETMRIGAIMRKLGWIKDRETSGARERFYARPQVAATVAAEAREGDDAQLPF